MVKATLSRFNEQQEDIEVTANAIVPAEADLVHLS